MDFNRYDTPINSPIIVLIVPRASRTPSRLRVANPSTDLPNINTDPANTIIPRIDFRSTLIPCKAFITISISPSNTLIVLTAVNNCCQSNLANFSTDMAKI